MTLEELQYPIGEFRYPAEVKAHEIPAWIDSLEKLPSKIRESTQNLGEEEINFHYRPIGWRIQQVAK